MATSEPSDNHEEQQPQPTQRGKRVPLTEAQKKRLQKCFDHAAKQMEQGGYDYATDLFTQCLLGEPTNLSYAQNFLGNLHKKYNNNKRGAPLAQFKERGPRGALKKAVAQSEWDEAIKNGATVLKVNPWDSSALIGMATAAAGVLAELDGTLGDVELFYLKAAYEATPKDADVCRQVALALGKRQRFDEAIAFWHKVEQLRPGDEEAQRSISTLAVEKTIKQNPDAKKKGGLGTAGGAQKHDKDELSPEDQLKRSIRREPNTLQHYYDLSQLYLNSDQYKEAEEVLVKAHKISNNDPDVWEKLEDARLRDLRHQLVAAERKVKETGGNDELKAEVKRLLKAVIQKELAVWKSRCERYPTNLTFKYEAGIRYQRLGEYSEAIKEFQAAKNDPRRKGVCLFALGECFRHIKKYGLAESHYELAIQDIPDREADHKKLALYRAGKLAFDQKNLDRAEQHLAALAAMDFSYRDVSLLLDKISELREK